MKVSQLFNKKLLNKYNTSGPRYTSYPTAVEFSEQFNEQDLNAAISLSARDELSLYVHIPFCHSLCYYCGCHKIVTRHRDKADIYIDYLVKEIEQKAAKFQKYKVKQLHLGGGTPSFLTFQQLARLIKQLKASFIFADNIEMGIEIDPRELTLGKIDLYHSLGFNRLSIGVQDTDLKVQEAINRVQSTTLITNIVARAKAVGFTSVNVDLIYGLPHQTKTTFAKTLTDVLAMEIDRISLFSYAHLPERFAAQRKLKDEWLPSGTEKFSLMQQAIETLANSGFELIGMDHFAKPNDELAKAQNEGKLHRNFQGYTTNSNCDLLALGVSSISAIGNSFSQNHKALKNYYQAIDEAGHALEKGITLSTDDMIRAHVIKALMCNLFVDKQEVNQLFDIEFDQYFADELQSLDNFIQDGMLMTSTHWITVSSSARLLIRTIAMSFDAYMKKYLNQQRFSRVI